LGTLFKPIISAAALVVDFYLGDERSSEKERIVQLCKKTDVTTDELLVGYVCEALHPSISPLAGERSVLMIVSIHRTSTTCTCLAPLFCWYFLLWLQVSGVFRRATKSAAVQDGIDRVLDVKEGDLCFAYISQANLDVSIAASLYNYFFQSFGPVDHRFRARSNCHKPDPVERVVRFV
jgi:hypothetical protein